MLVLKPTFQFLLPFHEPIRLNNNQPFPEQSLVISLKRLFLINKIFISFKSLKNFNLPTYLLA
jgi:hypothetical protein